MHTDMFFNSISTHKYRHRLVKKIALWGNLEHHCYGLKQLRIILGYITMCLSGLRGSRGWVQACTYKDKEDFPKPREPSSTFKTFC